MTSRCPRTLRFVPTLLLLLLMAGTCYAQAMWKSPTAPVGNYRSVTYGNGQFVAVSNADKTMTSPDGVQWTESSCPNSIGWVSIAFGEETYVTVGTANPFIMTSPDGVTWSALLPTLTANFGPLTSVCYGMNRFVAVGNGGMGDKPRVVTSSDKGLSWLVVPSAPTETWRGVTFGKNTFVAVGERGAAMTSLDGMQWRRQNALRQSDQIWESVAYGNDKFVAVASVGYSAMYSPDGITWTLGTGAINNRWKSVTFGGGWFVAVATSGTGNRVMTSADGITWTSRTSATDSAWWGVAFGNVGRGLFVAVAPSSTALATVMTSEFTSEMTETQGAPLTPPAGPPTVPAVPPTVGPPTASAAAAAGMVLAGALLFVVIGVPIMV